MSGTAYTTFRRFAAAILFTALALFLRWLIDAFVGDYLPLATLYGSVAATVWFAGYRTALLAMVLGYLAADWLFVEPRHAFELLNAREVFGLLAYLLSCGVIIFFGESLRRARRDAEARTDEARLKQCRLEDEVAQREQADREREAAEARLHLDLEAMKRLQIVGTLCASSQGDFQYCLDRILDTAIALTDAAKGNMQLFDDGYAVLRIVAQKGFDEHFLQFFSKVADQEAAACGTAMRRGRRVTVEDVTESSIFSGQPSLNVVLNAGVRAVQSTPLISSAGKLVGMISTHFSQPYRLTERQSQWMDLLARQAADFLERKEFEHELRRLNQELRNTDRNKDEFLATLAHELRGPLAPLAASVELMKQGDGDASLRQQAREVMDRQCRQLARLVDDLIDVNRITHGKVELRREQVELASVISEAVEASRPLADCAHVALTVTVPQFPVYLVVDPARLVQVVSNILNNAIKYNKPQGHVWLTAEREGSDIVIKVKDTGLGIPPDKIANIFDLFAQVDHKLERTRGGLGIGLALAKQLVEMHGGTVKAASDGVGLGSEFVIRLPVVSLTPVSTTQETTPPTRNRSASRILIVDDNLDAAQSMAHLLGTFGHQTFTAHDGLEAIETAEKVRPAFILLDIGLPKLNGFDACRRIRQQPWGKEILIAALSGWGQDEDRRRAEEAGFDRHFTKPVQSTELLKLLAERPAATA